MTSTGLGAGQRNQSAGLVVLFLVVGSLLASACGDDASPDGRRSMPTPAATSRATATPGAAPSVAAACCPREVTLAIDGPGVDLDLGATGVNYDTRFPRGFAIPLAAECPDATAADCGICTLGSAVPVERRCFADMSRTCSQDGDCPTAACVPLLSPPLPLDASGLPSCAINEILSLGPGSLDPATGEVALPLTLRWTFYSGLDVAAPCPVCSGARIDDAGVCQGGSHDGDPCTVDASDDLLGNTSYDCPPNPTADVGAIELPMALTTGTSRLAGDQTCTSEPFMGLPCYCAGQPIANVCVDGRCLDAADGDFVCADGPEDGFCGDEPFRSCRDDAGCPLPQDQCAFRLRECLGTATETDGVTSPLERTGQVGPMATLVATFCVPPGTTAVGNVGLGLPAAASLRLPVAVETTTTCAAAGAAAR
jgi:hypothetical protein